MKFYTKARGLLMRRYRNDIILIVSLLAIAIIAIICMRCFSSKDNLKACVYYKDELILSFDLDKDEIYEVNGDLGIVKIEVKNNSVSVIESNCPDAICIHSRAINNTSESIACLPNRIYIKLVGKNEGVDVTI